MMFKSNPKAQVSDKFRELFGYDQKIEVIGARVPVGEGSRYDTYEAQLFVEGTCVAMARNNDWRRAYKLLKIEVEKLYGDGVIL
jgi:hypothetical protein